MVVKRKDIVPRIKEIDELINTEMIRFTQSDEIEIDESVETNIDTDLAYTLELHYENTRHLDELGMVIMINYVEKALKGNYDRILAIKGIVNNFIPEVIKDYRKKEKKEGKTTPMVAMDTKIILAIRFVDYFEIEYELGNI